MTGYGATHCAVRWCQLGLVTILKFWTVPVQFFKISNKIQIVFTVVLLLLFIVTFMKTLQELVKCGWVH